jgi:FdhD protein
MSVQAAPAFIGLGSNLENPERQVLDAFGELAALPGVTLLRRSSLYRSAPVGYVDQPDFINAVAEIRTALAPHDLLAALQGIERRHGRRREFKNSPRTLDLDILIYADLTLDTNDLVLPHPGIFQRAFVLLPLIEIAPDACLPGIGVLAKRLPDCRDQQIERLKTFPTSPLLSRARCELVISGSVLDQDGCVQTVRMPGERALTLYLDRREIVTLMTLGQFPEALTLGYLRNQRLLGSLADIAQVHVDWEAEAAAVTSSDGRAGDECAALLSRRTVTAGCGQGTQFGNALDQLAPLPRGDFRITRSALHSLVNRVRLLDTVYKQAGAVHGCVLADGMDEGHILHHVEDIGRHNAVDSIAGLMWLNGESGANRILYTTGRLTSEMVIKVVEMGIPVLISRSGTTEMGLVVARQCGVTLIGRARNERFLVFHGAERLDFDR